MLLRIKKSLQFHAAVALIFVGILHLVYPKAFLPMIPPYLPFPEFVNAAAGIAEIVIGVGLLSKRHGRSAAFGLILMLFAFIPAHIYHIQMDGCVSDLICIPRWAAELRLYVGQPLLILIAFWFTRNHA